MTEPINQHHVPQTYLKNFSSKKKDDYYVWTWDNRTKKVFNSNIENVAVERHFYTIDNLQDKYVWETFYAKTIEPLMNRKANADCCCGKQENVCTCESGKKEEK